MSARRGRVATVPPVAVVLLLAALALAAPRAAAARGIGGMVPDVPTGTHLRHVAPAHAAALRYQGGPVLHSNRTHLIFWQPAGSSLAFDPGYEALMERFLTQVAADSHRPTNVYGLSGQYSDQGGPAAYDSTYGGAVVASDPLPLNGCAEPPVTGPGWLTCLTDAQLQQELERVVAADGLPRAPTEIYFLVLPRGLGTCTDSTSASCALGGTASGYCGYHSQAQDDLLYAVIPYNAVAGHCESDNPRPNQSAADPALSTISHEHNETVTDPETYASWIDPSGDEDGDLCITTFGPDVGGSGTTAWNEVIGHGHYYLQEEWSNEDGSCRPRDESDSVYFWAPSRVSTGQKLSLTARAADPDGRVARYSWFFGDGGVSHRRVTGHVFRRAGTYRLVLRIADSADNWGSWSRTVRVVAAAAPAPRRRARGRRPAAATRAPSRRG